MTDHVYNPLDIGNLGRSVAETLLRQDPTPLGNISRFEGAGIYALYYTGDFGAYRLLSESNRGGRYGQPIYVGKAVPPGARKGLTRATGTTALSARLREHAASLEQASNLLLADFSCRFLIIEPIWIPLAESLLINRFSPIWNSLVDGFGNHDPGSGRHNGLRPRWDAVHPGRPWALKLVERSERPEDIETDITAYLAQRLG